MTMDDKFINIFERSLLTDLVGLYRCDLTREIHAPGCFHCIACSKQEIIRAISNYIELDKTAQERKIDSVQELNGS